MNARNHGLGADLNLPQSVVEQSRDQLTARDFPAINPDDVPRDGRLAYSHTDPGGDVVTRLITDSHVAATLRVAASIVDLNGWCCGGYVQGNVRADAHTVYPVCVMGAVAQAAGLAPDAWDTDPQDADAALAHALMQRAVVELGVYVGVFRPGEIPAEEDVPTRLGDGWNDSPERTAEQVARALRATADGLEVAA